MTARYTSRNKHVKLCTYKLTSPSYEVCMSSGSYCFTQVKWRFELETIIQPETLLGIHKSYSRISKSGCPICITGFRTQCHGTCYALDSPTVSGSPKSLYISGCQSGWFILSVRETTCRENDSCSHIMTHDQVNDNHHHHDIRGIFLITGELFTMHKILS